MCVYVFVCRLAGKTRDMGPKPIPLPMEPSFATISKVRSRQCPITILLTTHNAPEPCFNPRSGSMVMTLSLYVISAARTHYPNLILPSYLSLVIFRNYSTDLNVLGQQELNISTQKYLSCHENVSNPPSIQPRYWVFHKIDKMATITIYLSRQIKPEIKLYLTRVTRPRMRLIPLRLMYYVECTQKT